MLEVPDFAFKIKDLDRKSLFFNETHEKMHQIYISTTHPSHAELLSSVSQMLWVRRVVTLTIDALETPYGNNVILWSAFYIRNRIKQ